MMIQFENNLLKRYSNKKFKIRNCLGNKQAWRWIKKNKWLNIGQPITEKLFGYIIKTINNYLIYKLLKGSDIVFPCGMGKLELRKYESKILIEEGKIKTNLPIDWKRTIQLWKLNLKAFDSKFLVRYEPKMLFNIHYNKRYATYTNKRYYLLLINRRVKKLLSDKIKNNEIDTFILDYGKLH